MIPKPNQNLAIVLSSILALPASMFLALSAPQNQISFHNETFSSIQMVSFAPQAAKIAVLEQMAGRFVQPGITTRLAVADCGLSLPGSTLQLQNGNLINLNQPASCFSLKSAAPVASNIVVLKVAPNLNYRYNQVVVLRKLFFESEKISTAVPAQEQAVVAFYFFPVNLAFFIAARSAQGGKSIGRKEFFSRFSIYRLHILRC